MRRMRFRGWALTGWIGLALVVMSALVLAVAGSGEAGVRMLIRATARSSAVLFLIAFLARPLRQLWRTPATAFALANRRYFGVSMAVSHGIHGCAIVWLLSAFPAAYQLNATTLVGGGLGFVFIAALTATSSDAAVRALGRSRWTLLHRTGVWYLWFVFAFTFVPDPSRGWDALHAGFVAAFAAALLLRAAAWAKTRGRARAQATA
jgi:methionine sulfoxide reductase heme-binding subunit